MKVQIVGLRIGVAEAGVQVKLPNGHFAILRLPTDDELTMERLQQAISSELKLFQLIRDRVKLLESMVGSEIDIPD